jgi:hypothetical protein
VLDPQTTKDVGHLSTNLPYNIIQNHLPENLFKTLFGRISRLIFFGLDSKYNCCLRAHTTFLSPAFFSLFYEKSNRSREKKK